MPINVLIFRGGDKKEMKKILIAVCDDVLADAVTLEKMIYEVLPEADVRIFTSGETLLKVMESKGNPFRMIFLDIHMPGRNGIETARDIRTWDKAVPIVIVSNSDRYYKDAFEVYVYQYLIKPVDKGHLSEILNLLKRYCCKVEEPVLHFRYRSQTYTLLHSQVSFISSSLHIVLFHLTDGRTVQCRGKLNDFTEQLEGSSFVRCHQSFFVNMDAVTGMKPHGFLLGDTLIPISRSFLKEVQERYTAFLCNNKI